MKALRLIFGWIFLILAAISVAAAFLDFVEGGGLRSIIFGLITSIILFLIARAIKGHSGN